MSLAPIVLFVYNRPEHTRRTVEALQKNNLAIESDFIIFSDGPKNLKDNEEVNEVRNYLKTIIGFKSVQIIERSENCGLAKSIISGVTEVVNKYGKIIVLEDDLVTSPFFLQFMNNALDMYNDECRVISINGYVYPVKGDLPETFFIKTAECWGWATWKRGWDLFEADGKKLLAELRDKQITKEFDFEDSYPYVDMLEDQIVGKNSSWAIRWYASAFVNDKLTLFPGRSLVNNFGFDASGRHCGCTSVFDTVLTDSVDLYKISIEENILVRKKFVNYFRSIKRRNLLAKLKPSYIIFFIYKKFLKLIGNFFII